MAKNKVELGCQQLRGTFELNGKITGRFSSNFYADGTGQNGSPYRRVHFGVEIERGKVIYLDLFGVVQDTVYFSKRDRATGKTETKSVPWARRIDSSKKLFGEENWRLIGVTCGCEKVLDKNGREVNNTKHLTAFDACDEVSNLDDGNSVYVRGNITYSTYNDTHRVNFEPTQISLLSKEMDFDDPDFKPNASFTQAIVYMGIGKNEETPGEAVVSAKIVNYQSIEDTELYAKDARLAKNLKGLKPYTHIKVWGNIEVQGELQEVKEMDGGWGSANKMERVPSPFVRKLMITGADPDTIDTEAYSEDVIEHAMEVIAGIQGAKKDYGKKDEKDEGWGSKKGNLDDYDDDDMDLGI